jgi:hypothetical protein
VGRHFKAPFALEEEAIRRYGAHSQLAFKDAAAKGMNLTQILGVNEYSPIAVVLFADQIDQLPGRTAVKIPLGPEVQVAVAPLALDTEIAAHICLPIVLNRIQYFLVCDSKC